MRVSSLCVLLFACTLACGGGDSAPAPDGAPGGSGGGVGGAGGQGGTGGAEEPACGNGIVEPGEECDEGARNSDTLPNRCRETCVLPRCGDGVVDEGEACEGDDSATCVEMRAGLDGLVVCGPDCAWDTSDCWKPEDCRSEDGVNRCDDPRCAGLTEYCPICGDGEATADEACDGDDFRGKTCADFGFARGTLVCADDCRSVSTDACSLCGNLVIDEGEECDSTNLAGQNCRRLGFAGGILSCTAECTFDTSRCEPADCGDGAIEGFEECDGENLAGKTCRDFSFAGGILACDADCRFDTSACTAHDVCGDRLLGSSESCDDGNVQGGDGCGPDCRLEAGVCGAAIVDLGAALVSGPDGPEYVGTLDGAGADGENGCQDSSGPDRVHALFVEARSLIRFVVESLEPAGELPLSIAVRTDCASPATETACDASPDGPAQIEVPVEARTQIYVLVDTASGVEGGSYRLRVDAKPMVGPGAACNPEVRCEPPYTCSIGGICKDCRADPFCL